VPYRLFMPLQLINPGEASLICATWKVAPEPLFVFLHVCSNKLPKLASNFTSFYIPNQLEDDEVIEIWGNNLCRMTYRNAEFLSNTTISPLA
jgi:hypothetical protein